MVSDVLILGGGLAGGAAAALLARAGTPVRLLEREKSAHHKICGEFLSGEAQRDLSALGLDIKRLGAVQIDRVKLHFGKRSAESQLPFVARSISRKILDEALLELAEKNGAQVERGVRVTAINGQDVSTSAGPDSASHILLATGKHQLRGAKPAWDGATGDYVGFKMHWKSDAQQGRELNGLIELTVFDGGYAGLQMVDPDVMNLSLIIRKDRLANLGGKWESLLEVLLHEPGLARRLDNAEALFPRALTIANLPYGYVIDPRAPMNSSVFHLGDQAAMTASITGDGMAAAVRSAHIAAECIAAGLLAAVYHQKIQNQVSGQIRRAMFLQRVTEVPFAIQAGFSLLRLWPKLLGTLAGATRLPER